MTKEASLSGNRSRRAFVLLCLICLTSGVAMIHAQSSERSGSSPATTVQNYRIGPGDVVDVIVSNNERLSRTGLRVSNLGTIQLAMIESDVPAACLTERELADQIREKYRKYLVEPFVNVSVKESNSNPVAVIGAVNSPGRFQMQRSIRLVELLTLVNGTAANAGRTVEIFRNSRQPYCDGATLVIPSEGEDTLITVTIADAFGGTDNNPVIVSGDIVRIPEAAQIPNAYIQGNVRTSLVISLREPITITQAIAMAGGPTQGAQLEKVIIRRPIAGSVNREELIANVKEIRQGKRDDVLIQANDIIEVPGPSGVKKVFQDLLRTIVPTITQLPVRVVP